MKKRITALLLTALILLLVSACANAPADAGEQTETPPESSLPDVSSMDIERLFGLTDIPDISDVPVATLGENTVLRSDYAFYFENLRGNAEYDALNNGYTEENMQEYWDLPVDDEGTLARDMLRTLALQYAKEFAVLHAAAVRNGTEPDAAADQQSDLEVLSMLSEHQNNEQEFADAYKLTSAQMRDVFYRLNLVSKFMSESMEKTTVSEESIRALYDESPEAYDVVTVRHILISCDDSMSQEEQDAAKLKAEDILQQIKNGADIGQLAAEHSEDPGSQFTNGEYTFGKGQMVPEFEDWSFTATQGEQGIVKSEYGYHVMELITPPGYESAKEDLANQLRQEIFYQSLNSERELVESEDWVLNQEVIDSFTL